MFVRVPKNLVALAALVAVAGASVVALSACATTHGPFDYSKEPDPRKSEYVIGPSDGLTITVWHNADLSASPIVRPDGTISLPLIGDLRAAGRTPTQIRNEVTQRLGTFLKDESAIVTVAVTAIKSYRFTVSGNVERAGEFNLDHYVTASQAITLAGGPSRLATPEETVIIRADPQRGLRRIPIDYPKIMDGTRAQEDLPILAGDMIYVP